MKVVDILNNEWECECVGCSISQRKMTPPGGIIVSTKNFDAYQDPKVPIEGFVIIAEISYPFFMCSWNPVKFAFIYLGFQALMKGLK